MSFEYWTTLVEPRICVADPFDCKIDLYDKWLEAILTLKGVNVKDWTDTHDLSKDYYKVELRLAFD